MIFEQINHNELAKEIFEGNVAAGWWNLEKPREDGTTLSLIHSEISEAASGFKSGRADDHLPQYDNWLTEIADAIIRLYDFSGFKGWDLDSAIKNNQYPNDIDLKFSETDAGWYFCNLHEIVSGITECIRKDNPNAIKYVVLAMKELYSINGGNIDLPKIIADKRAYNAQRADHKPENRAKSDGKKF